MRPEQVAAHTLLTSLEPGDRVILTTDGQAREVTVQPFGTGRADGAFGSAESYGVTVGYGPGRWNTKITVDALAGYGPVKAGKPMGKPSATLERVSEPPTPELGPCQWFARCDRQADHLEPHPVLGPVPACTRCTSIGR